MVKIRKENLREFACVEQIAREAFWNLYQPGAYEHFLIHKMRNHKDYIAELSFVIEIDKKVQGAIFYTHSKIVLNNKTILPTISFGPVFISAQMQRKGYGRALIEHSITAAKNAGHTAIIILGYPHHYKSCGFVGAKTYNISMPDNKFYTGLLALPLQMSALDNVSGCAVFSSVFELDEHEVTHYDQTNFSPMPKLILPSQAEFAKACIELDQ